MGGRSTSDLAVAVAAAGGLGMLSGADGRGALAEQLDALPSDATVGVNFLVPFLERDAFEEVVARARYIELFWGDPQPELSTPHTGRTIGSPMGSADEARAANDTGCDVIIAQGIEAGGHVRGTVGLLALLSEVRPLSHVVLVAAGGIGNRA
jgi:nitronate monooxygenase